MLNTSQFLKRKLDKFRKKFKSIKLIFVWSIAYEFYKIFVNTVFFGFILVSHRDKTIGLILDKSTDVFYMFYGRLIVYNTLNVENIRMVSIIL